MMPLAHVTPKIPPTQCQESKIANPVPPVPAEGYEPQAPRHNHTQLTDLLLLPMRHRSRASVQPKMVMVLKEIQPTNIQPPASSSGIDYPVSAQPITETKMETSLVMKNFLGLQPPSQTFCVTQTQEL
ncbi:hypothetical protein EI555_009744 [Monodon monoceros]|uniref:Uncharacterized protein n=1 Tax=Monodon monoceros TaxID=40151 RepID=A0A4U1ECD4_MONMO|nr:hypothetical protein EI555_009744 [Monodon monoceros]